MLFMANNTLHIVVIYIIKYISDYHLLNTAKLAANSRNKTRLPANSEYGIHRGSVRTRRGVPECPVMAAEAVRSRRFLALNSWWGGYNGEWTMNNGKRR